MQGESNTFANIAVAMLIPDTSRGCRSAAWSARRWRERSMKSVQQLVAVMYRGGVYLQMTGAKLPQRGEWSMRSTWLPC